MVKNRVNLRYLILGLLTQKALTGYDIKVFLESFSWLIGSPSYGSLYPTLHALRDDKLVSQEVLASRKIYSITSAGQQKLEKWSGQTPTQETSLKTFLMHLILAKNYSPEVLESYLHQRQTQIKEQRRALQEMLQIRPDREKKGQKALALEYGLFMATQELKWLKNILSETKKI